MQTREPYRIEEPDKTLGELVGRLSGELGELVKGHVELAKLEMKEEVSKAGRGAGMLGAGGAIGYLALILLSFAAAWGLAEVMPEGLAFLIVGAVWAVVAAVVLMRGRDQLREVQPAPDQTLHELEEDRRWLKRQEI